MNPMPVYVFLRHVQDNLSHTRLHDVHRCAMRTLEGLRNAHFNAPMHCACPEAAYQTIDKLLDSAVYPYRSSIRWLCVQVTGAHCYQTHDEWIAENTERIQVWAHAWLDDLIADFRQKELT